MVLVMLATWSALGLWLVWLWRKTCREVDLYLSEMRALDDWWMECRHKTFDRRKWEAIGNVMDRMCARFNGKEAA